MSACRTIARQNLLGRQNLRTLPCKSVQRESSMRYVYVVLVIMSMSVAEAQVAQSGCKKSITFAVASDGSLDYRLPNVSSKWFSKAQKKYPNVCFSQFGESFATGNEHYLIVLSTQSSAFNGLYPAFRTSTNTAMSPTSGSGTITDNSGSAWNYTYQGTITTTTTTTTEANLPYTDTTLGLYANAYTEEGKSIGSAQRSETFRQGGDAANTLGYNIGARLSSINVKERLLEEIVTRINSLPPEPGTNRGAEKQFEETPKSEPITQQATGNDYDKLWLNAEVGVKNIYTFANGRNLHLEKIDDTASNSVGKCIIDAQSSGCFDNWTLAQKSFAWTMELGSAIRAAKSTNDSLLGTVAVGLTSTWSDIKDIYCQKSLGASYTNLEGGIASCP